LELLDYILLLGEGGEGRRRKHVVYLVNKFHIILYLFLLLSFFLIFSTFSLSLFPSSLKIYLKLSIVYIIESSKVPKKMKNYKLSHGIYKRRVMFQNIEIFWNFGTIGIDCINIFLSKRGRGVSVI